MASTTNVIAAINLRLSLLGLPIAETASESAASRLVQPILARQRELSRRLADRLCPADQRVQAFLDSYLADTDVSPQLPQRTLILDTAGLARGLSLPAKSDSFTSPLLSSYRLRNGVLHNPANDRRTTAGVFHIAEGGLPIPDDKLAVPKAVYARLLVEAFKPPRESMVLPFTSEEVEPAEAFVTLLLRPLVVPEVPGYSSERRMETRFIVPGGLVANLDFVESIFGNAGDPQLPENDAALHPDHWTGTTGCVILAPHLTSLTKKELGLPAWEDATERQRRDGMAWKTDDELYNNGQAFKCCARDERGVMVTVIADNYFGYCKKEVKTQISYSANLFGGVEEEHAGGALVFTSHNQGQEFTDDTAHGEYTLQEVLERDPDRFALQPEGHALDTQQTHLVLVPADSTYSLRDQTITWRNPDGETSSIRFRADKTYLGPNGYRVHMAQLSTDGNQWSIIGTYSDYTSCHKPSTVSGGGKSEISKAITDAIILGNAYVADFDADMDAVQRIIDTDFVNRFREVREPDRRPILSDARSVGSVIKLLTPNRTDFTDAYNAWLGSIPPHIKELVFVVKRFYRPEWGSDWRSHFSVPVVNGRKGVALRLDGQKIAVNTLRVGFEADGSWRIFGLRHDFNPAVKVQTEDDISASIVTPPHTVNTHGDGSAKFVQNCENLLFQRPDDAIYRGYDKQAELDISAPGTFLSNFEPLTASDARAMMDDAIGFSAFTEPMQALIRAQAEVADGASPEFFVSSANPRLVNGKPSKNPRYLQERPDVANPQATATADLAIHLYRRTPTSEPAPHSVDIIAAGRRNNPPEPGVPPLCAFNPLHFMELPELFMEYISSMTGKSPSTTGAGSEGAMTKGPFNAMPATFDLNAALLSYILTGYDGWVSCAGYVGPKVRVDHDISMLVPEVFARMSPRERRASALIEGGYLERLTDFEHNGQEVLASRLGYRMTDRFMTTYFGRIFLHPHVIFTDEMLQPERQDVDVFAEAMATMVATHQRVAKAYFDDGTIEYAVPPLRALLEIMATGVCSEGWDLDAPEFRHMFDRDAVLASDWYAARLDAKQAADLALAQHAVDSLEEFLSGPNNADAVRRLGLDDLLERARDEVTRFRTPAYRDSLVGTLGRDPLG